MVERAALEMRYTHYVVSGVRIPHSPQKNVENQASQRFFIENERNNKQIERNELKNKGSKL